MKDIYTRKHGDAFTDRVFNILKSHHHEEPDEDLYLEAKIIASIHLDDISAMLDRLTNRIIEEGI